jgi:hypothetical protein
MRMVRLFIGIISVVDLKIIKEIFVDFRLIVAKTSCTNKKGDGISIAFFNMICQINYFLPTSSKSASTTSSCGFF